MKARSRLKLSQERSVATPTNASSTPLDRVRQSVAPPTRSPLPPRGEFSHLKPKVDISHYTAHLGTLFLGLVFGFLTIALMRSIYPSSIANFLLPQLYLPFQALFFLSIFFISSFMWLNTRRGYLTAAALQLLVFLRLQHIVVTWQLVLGIVTLFVIIEVLFSYLETHKNASFHQNLKTRHRRTRA